jgi:hypothetical protein
LSSVSSKDEIYKIIRYTTNASFANGSITTFSATSDNTNIISSKRRISAIAYQIFTAKATSNTNVQRPDVAWLSEEVITPR